MKKIIALLVAAIMLVSLWSCSESAKETEPVKETEPASSANSASNQFVLTKEMISDMLKETQAEACSAKGSLSAEKQTLPDFMSLEKVQALAKDKDYSFGTRLTEYEDTVAQKFYALIDELPEKCITSHYPEWIINALPEVKRYIVLDPEKLPEDYTSEIEDMLELGLYLEWEYYSAQSSVDECYDMNKIKELEERFADIGTVLVETRGSAWKYLDTEANTVERIEFFPNHREIELEFFKSLTVQMDERYSVDLPEN